MSENTTHQKKEEQLMHQQGTQLERGLRHDIGEEAPDDYYHAVQIRT